MKKEMIRTIGKRLPLSLYKRIADLANGMSIKEWFECMERRDKRRKINPLIAIPTLNGLESEK